MTQLGESHRAQLSDDDVTVERAELALAFARAALDEAERFGATPTEVVQLCDEVIARRLRLQEYQMRAGWRPSPAVREQMARDRVLVHTAATEDLRYQADVRQQEGDGRQ